MENEDIICEKCHTGKLLPTDQPRMKFCNSCGRARMVMTFQEYIDKIRKLDSRIVN